MWKAFIEMGDEKQAENALNGLNNFPIFFDGSNMNVYESNMRNLFFQNNNSGGVDYTLLEQQMRMQQQQAFNNINVSNMNNLSMNLSCDTTSTASFLDDSPFLSIGHFGSQSDSQMYANPKKSKDEFRKNLNKYLDPVSGKKEPFTQKFSASKSFHDENFDFKELAQSIDEMQIESSKEEQKMKLLQKIEGAFEIDMLEKMENSLNKIDEFIDQKNQQNQQFSPIQEQSFLDPSTYVNPLFIQENKKSKVIYIRNLESQYITIPHLYNLFSNFGNIVKMIFLRSKKSCLIEFQNYEYSTNAKELLNNKIFFQNPIRIFYSNYESINLKDSQQNFYLGFNPQEDVFIGEECSFRFKKNKNMSINPPSVTLHVSNLKKESCNENYIFQIFQQFGYIEGVKTIMQQQKNMCLVKFSSIEESINAIASMHGEEIMGRQIQISFTQSKIQ